MNVKDSYMTSWLINSLSFLFESNTSEVLGSFSADHAALFTVSKNLKTNELSLAFQKDGNPIYLLKSLKPTKQHFTERYRQKINNNVRQYIKY